jgi:Integrase core domain
MTKSEQIRLTNWRFKVLQQAGDARCVAMEWFKNRIDAKVVIESFRRGYNEVRPHSSLGQLTPVEFKRSLSTSNPARAIFLENSGPKNAGGSTRRVSFDVIGAPNTPAVPSLKKGSGIRWVFTETKSGACQQLARRGHPLRPARGHSPRDRLPSQ